MDESDLVNRFIHMHGRLPTEYDPDYLELLRMTKYRILDVPDVSPSKCGNCGSTKKDGRTYVDFGLHVDWYGALFLCSLCVNDIAKAMGIFDKYNEEIASLKNKLDSVHIAAANGADLEEKVLHIFEEVKDYFDSLHSTRDNATASDVAGMESDKSESISETVTESGGKSAEVHKRATKSTTSSGPKDLPSLAELLKSNT